MLSHSGAACIEPGCMMQCACTGQSLDVWVCEVKRSAGGGGGGGGNSLTSDVQDIDKGPSKGEAHIDDASLRKLGRRCHTLPWPAQCCSPPPARLAFHHCVSPIKFRAWQCFVLQLAASQSMFALRAALAM